MVSGVHFPVKRFTAGSPIENNLFTAGRTSNIFYLTLMFIHTSTNTSARQFVVFFLFLYLLSIKKASTSQYLTFVQCLKIYHVTVKFDTSINNSTLDQKE